jgi:hypothetical protein
MRALLLIGFLSLGACSWYSPDLGAQPFKCGSASEGEARCPEGYMCQQMGSGSDMGVCIKPGSTFMPDSAFAGCNNDQNLEPNESKDNAWQTPVDTMTKNFPLAGLAICPAGDKDTFAVTLSTMENLEVVIIWDEGGATLQGAIQGSGGISIANASPVSGMTNTIRAYVPNVPAGTYFAQVYGPSTPPATANYRMTFTVTP